MKLIRIANYYFRSFVTLFSKTNWWMILKVIILKPQFLRIKGFQYGFFVDNLMDIWTVKEVLIDDCYLLKKLSNQKNVIDVGSGIGDFAIYMGKKSQKVFTFDPNLNRAKICVLNIQTHHSENVFFRPNFVTSIDEIFLKEKISECDLLKIDCEGAEYDIFQNTSDSVLKTLKKIVGEIHLFDENMKNKYIKLKDKLRKNGFTIHESENPVHDNILFIFAEQKK